MQPSRKAIAAAPYLCEHSCMRNAALDISALNLDERMELLESLWESLGRDPASFPMDEAQTAELARRLSELETEGPTGLSWEEVVAQARATVR